jgi:alpha-amylase
MAFWLLGQRLDQLRSNFGTKEDLAALVQKHTHGIRIILDGVINHTGPVTAEDTVWPNDWVRTGPNCDYKSFENTTACTLVSNLPDIKQRVSKCSFTSFF